MPKIIKIIISILIAISIAVNPFCGVFNVNASAAVPAWLVPLIIDFLTAAGEGLVLGGAAYGAAELADRGFDYEQSAKLNLDCATSAVGIEDGLSFNVTNGGSANGVFDGRITVSLANTEKLTSEQLEFAEFFCDYFNKGGLGINVKATSAEYVGIGEGAYYYLSSEQYAEMKSTVTNAFNQYNYEKTVKELTDKGLIDIAGSLTSAPTLSDFSFVGPQQIITFPSSEGVTALQKDGFIFTAPVHSSSFNDVGRFKTRSAACQFYKGVFLDCTPDWFMGDDVNGYYAHNWFLNANGASLAFIYNDDVYYYEIQKYSNLHTAETIGFYVWYNYDLSAILSGAKNAKGEILGDIATVNSDFSVSLCANKGSVVASSMPISTVNYEDFEQTTGGGTVEIPLTPAEQVVAEALKLGLLSDDSMLTIGEDGAITAADGIDLASVEKLLEEIKTGQLDFASFEEYLQLISQLIANDNLTEAEQATLLANIETATKAQTKSIDEIKTAVKSISEAMTIDSDFEIENTLTLPNLEDKTVTIGGMPEAEMLIQEALPIVDQSKTLITNLFQNLDGSERIPNISFYWDSNKDGIDEVYTVFDLSFMETELNNSKLTDKNRFKKPMTVREFVQSLIILVVYVAFALKMLKKVPGLFGFGESGGEIKSVSSTDVSGQIPITSDKNANW